MQENDFIVDGKFAGGANEWIQLNRALTMLYLGGFMSLRQQRDALANFGLQAQLEVVSHADHFEVEIR